MSARLFAVWRRVLALSWSVMAEQTLRTLMRTTDVVVTGLFSPAAVAAVGLARAYGLSAPFLVLFVVLSGALQGGSDTRTPFVARTTGMVLFMVGVSWLVGVHLGLGVGGAYAGIVSYHVWMTLVVAAGFRWGDWAARATAMMHERGSVERA